MKFKIEPHQDKSIPTDAQVQQVADQEDRIFLDSLREFENMRRRNLDRLVEMIASDPKLRAQLEATQRNKFQPKLDLSSLEKIAARTHTGRMTSSRSNIEHVSPTLRRMSGVTRGVVQRYPRMSDNLPRDGRIKVDVAPGKRIMQTDIHLGDVKTDDLSMAMVTAAFGLSGEQLGVIPAESGGGQSVPQKHLSYIDEAAYVPDHLPVRFLHSEKGPIVDFKTSGDPKGPQQPTVHVSYKATGGNWSAERRGRAATSASDRKKLRAKTRAQKKARRKQR